MKESVGDIPPSDHWVPFPLRPWFWVPLVVLLLLGAIGLQVAHAVANKQNGP